MNRNVPKLRFKGFEDEWKEKKISDTLKIRHGKDQKLVANDLGKYPILGTGGIIGKSNEFLYDKESVLIGRKGTIDRPFYMNTPFWTVDTLFYSEIKKGFCAKFLYYSFQRINWKKYSEASGVPSLSASTIESIKYILPELSEQEKITNFLSKVDSIIEKQEKKVEYWNSYKKGMMQKIFSQKIRFKDENGRDYPEWQKRKLGNVCLMFSGGTPASKNKIYYDGDIPFIRSAEINSFTTELKISELGLKNSSAKIVDKGDLLYALYGATSGEVGIARMKGAINQAILCIRSKEIINCYLLNLLQYNKEKIIETYIQGGQGNLSASILKELNFDFPCLEEQTKIANFLSNIDNIIEKESNKLEELRQWKKGLLQQMFV
ncbi:TPA: restriction endonuclease subunit S [Clostridium perfringens]|nr:restriction endonuclease subunit S [Clostridium perfringens]